MSSGLSKWALASGLLSSELGGEEGPVIRAGGMVSQDTRATSPTLLQIQCVALGKSLSVAAQCG